MFGRRHLLPRLLLFLQKLLRRLPFQDQHAFSPRLLLSIVGDGALQIRPENRLMLLGQLPADRYLPVSQSFQQLLQRLHQPVGRLIERNRPRLCLQLLQNLAALLFVRRQKGLKGKAPGSQAGKGQRRHTGAGSREGCHRNPRLRAHFHQLFSRIGDARHPRVRDKGDIFSFLKAGRQFAPFFKLIILMIAGHGRVDVKMIQQLDAVARILRRDQIHFPEYAHGPEGHVLQVSDGRRAQI